MKKFVEKVLIVVLLLLIVYSGRNLLERNQVPVEYARGEILKFEKLLNQKWPKKLLSPDIANLKHRKAIFFYSKLDCEQCTISHLKMLKAINGNMPIQILGSGEHLAFIYEKYKKIFGIDFPFIEDKSGIFLQIYPDIELPLFALLDDNNKTIAAWRAEVEKINYSKIIIEKYSQP